MYKTLFVRVLTSTVVKSNFYIRHLDEKMWLMWTEVNFSIAAIALAVTIEVVQLGTAAEHFIFANNIQTLRIFFF